LLDARPGPAPDAAPRAEFDRVLDEAVLAGPAEFIDYLANVGLSPRPFRAENGVAAVR
jgi:hypothetical protein